VSQELLVAKLAELAAAAKVTLIKCESNKHWDGELEQECARLSGLASEICRMASTKK